MQHIDGIISQDSDCFAYGAKRVFRNFSVARQGNAASQAGMVDVYDLDKINQHLDIGRHKIVAMALLNGCDYCEGVGGVGKDGIRKLFDRYGETEILEVLRSWRTDTAKFRQLELTVEDKNKCNSCGHSGKTATHTRKGCTSCGTVTGCDTSLWK